MKITLPVCFACMVAGTLYGAATESLPLADRRIEICGLGWLQRDQPALVRLPANMQTKVRPPVWQLAQVPSGVRLRFATDSMKIGFLAQGSGNPPSPHMTAFATSGVDLYVDGHYFGSSSPDKNGRLEKEWTVGSERRRRDIMFYLPIGKPLDVKGVSVEPDSNVTAPTPFRLPRPVVYYGSSITQGIAASNPGMAFPAQIGRMLNLDFINLGFSGNGLGEPELAEAVSEIDAACFVVDYWANPSTEVYKATLPPFVAQIRKRHPTTPIIVTGPYYNPFEDLPSRGAAWQKEKRAFAAEFVAERRQAGDANIYHLDGLEMIDRDHADALSDGRHANSWGFSRISAVIAPKIAEVLNLK